jgi:cobalt-zinc-cadmium resistance protein CzcA
MAVIDKSIAENQAAYFEAETRYNLLALLDRLQSLNERLENYEQEMLANAALIELNALKLYQAGDIGYIEYIQNMITSNQTKEDYWTLVKEHNRVIYEIEYFIYE